MRSPTGIVPPVSAGAADANGDRVPGTGKLKEFAVTSLAIRHPTSVVVLMLILIAGGLISYLRVPRESIPEIVQPNIFVTTVYGGVAPRDIETLVTQPLEDELNTIADVKVISSTSREGVSRINVEFVAGMDMTEALQRVREKVDLAKPELPSAANEPQIFESNFSQFPIMQVNIAGPYNQVRLREVAEDIQTRFEQIPSVLEAQLSGGLEREVYVDVDLAKLKFYGLAFKDVSDAVRDENVTVPGGSIEVGELKYLVRVPGEFEATSAIGDIVIETRDGRPVYVRDVAAVDFGFKERDSYARLDGLPVISLGIVKRSGANILATADAVRAVMAEVEPTLPPGTVTKITADQSNDIKDMVSSLENNIISGLLLVVGVLLFFLGTRTAPFVGLAIPLSMLISFVIIQFIGFTLNMVVLFSLILALGMLVDNAIVVVENIYRYRERGYSRTEAARFATGEVSTPIIASTATTLAAFVPLAFWPGIVGEFMKYLPLTLIITLSSSLFVALVILPTLASRLIETEGVKGQRLPPAARIVFLLAAAGVLAAAVTVSWTTAALLAATAAGVLAFNRLIGKPGGHWLIHHGLPWIVRHYEAVLRWALRRRAAVMALAVAALVGSGALYSQSELGREFFPEDIPPSLVQVNVETPLGTRVQQTDELVRAVEEQLAALPGKADVESVVATVGGSGTHLASVTVSFVPYEQRAADVFGTIEEVRAIAGDGLAGAAITVEQPAMGPPTGQALNIEIVGADPSVLKRLGDEVVRLLEESELFAKLDGLKSDMAAGRPELVVDVDRERAALHELSSTDVGNTIRSAINGRVASQFRAGEEEYDITVRLAAEYREDLDSLGDLVVVANDGAQIPLSSVASWRISRGLGDVTRKDLKRVVTVSSDVRAQLDGVDLNANAVVAEVRAEMEPFVAALPTGYTLNFTGQQQEQQESQSFLLVAFLLAAFLIGFILITQFDSVTKPLIIISSVVMSTVGVLLGLVVFKMPFVIVMTGVGVISLAGVVVNNAIVLIDYIDILRRRDGLAAREAIVRGGVTRFRPVILTAITTILGLVPLAIGLNFDFFGLYTDLDPEFYWGGEQAAWWSPMAIAVICGLAFATFLTLLLVPVMYSLFDDLDRWARRVFVARERGAAPLAAPPPAVVTAPAAAPRSAVAPPPSVPIGPRGAISRARPRMRD
ncbi:MAG: efflux RND transporter permease subunit [Spirochaetaceae bacterium]|nr:efflux RND transporter permease subunit [Spirochaetaceae bacterium]